MRNLFLFFFLLLTTTLYAQQREPEKVSVILKWFYQYQFAGIIMAKEKGFYEDAGLDVEIIERDPSKNNILQVIDGEAQYGIADSSILTYRAKGHPVRIVASIFQHNAMVLIARKDSDIVSPYEMRGKRISYQEGIDDAIFSSMFDYANLEKSDFIKVPMDFSYESIINGEVDVIAAYITDQPYWIKKRGVELNVINPLSYGIDLYGDILFTTEKEIASHPKRVKKMKAATLKGWEYALAHKDETIRTIIDKYKPALTYDQLAYEAATTERLIAPKHVALGYTSKDRFRVIAGLYHDLGLSQQALDKAVEEIIYDPDAPGDTLQFYLTAFTIGGAVMFIFLLLLYLHNQQLQRQVKTRTKELEKATLRAEKAAASKAQFLANMSHEIRTPMNAILGFIEQLAKGENDPARQKQFAIVKSSGRTLLGIINDILDFSKIESGKMSIECQPALTRDLFEEITALFKEQIEEKELLLETLFAPKLPECITTDAIRVKQVVFNLLGNAVKFTPKGGRIILEVRFRPDTNILHCSVRDTGIGIHETNIAKIFKAFEQEDHTTTRKFGGTGLGLAISSKLITLMGGTLEVESNPGEGSHFYFDLPAEPCEAHAPEALTQQALSGDTALAPQGDLLVVEDNKTNQMLLGIILDEFGIAYDIANDGLEAYSAAQRKHYAMILMDENMPNMNGIDATKKIRAWEEEHHLSRVPIVAVTANALSGDRERFIDAGMDDYLAKPFSETEVMQLLQRHL